MLREEIYKGLCNLFEQVEEYLDKVPDSYPDLEANFQEVADKMAVCWRKIEALHRFVTEEGYYYSDCCKDLMRANEDD